MKKLVFRYSYSHKENKMARPIKKGLEYFPFDVGFFSDKKIKILKSRYGADGIVIYQYLLCEIYKENGYYLIVDDDYEYIISDDLNMEINKVKQVINFLLERSLFNYKLFQSDKVLTSTGIQKRYQEAVKTKASKKAITIEKYWLLNEEETATYIKVTLFKSNSEINSNKSEINSSLSEEKCHKEKKSKLKESKEKDIAYFSNAELNDAFIQFLNMRQEAGKQLNGYQIQILTEKLERVADTDEDRISAVKNAIAGGWSNFYPPKKQQQQKKSFNGQRTYDYQNLEKKLLENRDKRRSKDEKI